MKSAVTVEERAKRSIYIGRQGNFERGSPKDDQEIELHASY